MHRIILALTLAILLPSLAFAQDRTPRPRPALTGDVVKDTKALLGAPQGTNEGSGGTGGGGGSLSSPLDKPFQDLANFIGDDIDGAISLATSMPALQDGNGQRCLIALKAFGDVVKAHPAPLTFKIATDLEAFRLKQMAINKLCLEQACTTVFADITQTIQAASAIPLPIPSLHDLCGKVPQIAVAAPVSVPAASPAAAPAPAPANQ